MFAQRRGAGAVEAVQPELQADTPNADAYDTAETVYLLVLDDVGQLAASVRMNPTWGRYELEAGSALRRRFATKEPPSGPTVWEASQLNLAPSERFGEEQAGRAKGILLIGLQEFCVRRGIKRGLSIVEADTFDWSSEPLGPPASYEGESSRGEVVAILWQANLDWLKWTREAFSVDQAVFFESSPSVGPQAEPLAWGLLESVADLRTEKAQSEVMKLAHQMRELELLTKATAVPPDNSSR